MQLVDDLILQVPRQDYNIIRLGLTDPIGMIDRNVAARQKAALLVRTAINGVCDEVFSNPAIMEQRCALARGPVSHNGFTLLRGI